MRNDIHSDTLNRASEAVWAAYFHTTWPLLLVTFLAAIGVVVLARILWAARRGVAPSFGVALGAMLSRSERLRLSRHARTQARARRRLKTLHTINPRVRPAAAMDYLRKVAPSVFEEMTLCELERRELRVVRDMRYTGDGGVDGRFVVGGVLWLVQAKRYSIDIDGRDVEAFEECCWRDQASGMFIHTGRTPPSIRSRARQSKVTIVSGDRLIAFFAGEVLTLRETAVAPVVFVSSHAPV